MGESVVGVAIKAQKVCRLVFPGVHTNSSFQEEIVYIVYMSILELWSSGFG